MGRMSFRRAKQEIAGVCKLEQSICQVEQKSRKAIIRPFKIINIHAWVQLEKKKKASSNVLAPLNLFPINFNIRPYSYRLSFLGNAVMREVNVNI